jgi:hypothetical protein
MDSAAVAKAMKYLGWLFIVLIIFIAIQAVNALKQNRYIGGGVPASNVVTVEGDGEVFAIPDTAEFTFSVVTSKKTVSEAQSEAAQKSNAIIEYLKKQGIDEKDIRTVNYSANPKYEWQTDGTSVYYPQPGKQVLTGYEINQTVTVKVRDTNKAGDVLSGVGGLGATNLSGISFTIDDDSALKREARQKAIADAKDKADALVADLDVHLVRIVSFYEQNGPIPYYGYGMGGDSMVAKEMSAQAVPVIPTGENKITSHVSITYEIR